MTFFQFLALRQCIFILNTQVFFLSIIKFYIYEIRLGESFCNNRCSKYMEQYFLIDTIHYLFYIADIHIWHKYFKENRVLPFQEYILVTNYISSKSLHKQQKKNMHIAREISKEIISISSTISKQYIVAFKVKIKLTNISKFYSNLFSFSCLISN